MIDYRGRVRSHPGCGRTQVRIAVNVASLVHRSLAALPADAMKAMEPARCAWRLVQHDDVKSALAPLTMGSNKKDKPHGQPPNFKQFPLRPEQQRSLGWMLQQVRLPGLDSLGCMITVRMSFKKRE